MGGGTHWVAANPNDTTLQVVELLQAVFSILGAFFHVAAGGFQAGRAQENMVETPHKMHFYYCTTSFLASSPTFISPPSHSPCALQSIKSSFDF